MSKRKELNLRNKLLISVLLLGAFLIMRNDVWAQANRSIAGDIVCPASGTSIEVVAARTGRFSLVVNNTSGVSIRIGYIASGTAALSSSNGLVMLAGQPYSDSAPGVNSGRLVCMSTTAGTATISFSETYR